MKLATLRDGTRDGRLVVVARDLSARIEVPAIAPSLQAALDEWAHVAPRLATVAERLNAGELPTAQPFVPSEMMAPLPRAYQWADASAYVNHVELVRRARGADLPERYWHEPLVYQGGSDDLLAATDDIVAVSTAHGIDFEAEVAVVTTDVPLATAATDAAHHIALIMLANDVSLRNLIADELGKGFGFYQSKPATAFSPVAATPDELGEAWRECKVHLPLVTHLNGDWFGAPECGVDMTFDFARIIAHLARTRRLVAGTIVGSGTVSNYDRARGSSCIAERRMLEMLAEGQPRTPFLTAGDRVRIEMFDAGGRSIFGAIEQTVVVPVDAAG